VITEIEIEKQKEDAQRSISEKHTKLSYRKEKATAV